MRTTINIDEHVLANARRRARERGRTLGQIVEEALQRELARPQDEKGPPIPVMRGEGGMNPRIDPSSNRSMWEFLDEGLDIDQLR